MPKDKTNKKKNDLPASEKSFQSLKKDKKPVGLKRKNELDFSVELMKRLFNNASFGCAFICSQKFTFVNKHFTKVLGYTIKDIPDVETWMNKAFPNPEIQDRIKKKLNKVLSAGKKEFFGTIEIQAKDGSTKLIRFHDNMLTKDCVIMFIEDITESFQTSKSLEENKQIFEQVFHAGNDAIYLWDVKGKVVQKIIMVNKAAEEMLGYTREEFQAMSPYDINPPENFNKIKNSISRLLKEGSIRFLTRHKKKNGQLIDVEINSKLVSIEKKKYVLSIVRDFTEIIEYQKSLKESEERAKNIVNSMPIGIHFYDVNEKNELIFSGFNEAACNILGVDHSIFMNKKIQEAFPTLSETEIPEKYFQTAITGKPWQKYFFNYDGGDLKGIYNINTFQISPGKMAATFLDVTEQIISDKALRNSEERYKTFINQISEGIWRVDFENPISIDLPVEKQVELIMNESKIGECNDIFVKMYGFSSMDEVLGKSLLEMYGGSINEINNQANVTFIKSGYKITNELTKEATIDGKTKYFLNNAVGVIKEGFLVNIWGTQLDVTHSKEVEEKNKILAGIIESTSDIVITFKQNGNVVYINESGKKNLGFDDIEINSLNISDLFAEKNHEQLVKEGIPIASKYGLWQGESKMFGSIKNEIPVSIVIVAHYSQNQEVEYFSSIIRDISEKMNYETAILESETKFKSIFESAPDGILLMKYDRIVDCNLSALKMFDCEKSNLIGKTPFDFSPEFQANGINSITYGKTLIDKTLKSGEQKFEWIHNDSKGNQFIVEIGLRKITLSGNAFLLGFLTDVTVKKTALDALKKSEELNRRLVESSPLGIIYIDRSGIINYENTASMVMMGLDPNKQSPLIGKNLLDLPGLKNLEAYKLLKKLMSGATLTNEELKFRSITGRQLDIRIFAAPILNDEQRYIGAIIMFQDVSETVKIKEALTESEKKLQLVIDSSPVVVYALDKDGKFTFSSGKGLSALGLKPGQIVGLSVYDVYKDFPDVIEDHKKAFQGETISNIYKVYNIDFDCHISPIYSPRNELIGVIGIAFDITERKKKDDILQNLSVGISTKTGKEFFTSVVKYLAGIFKIDIMFIGEKCDDQNIRTLAAVQFGSIIENFSYSLENTPCENLLEKISVIYDGNVQEKFPKDELLINFGINSYLGMSLFDAYQKPIGVFVALNKTTFENPQFLESVMRIFAIRISAELERLKYELEMQKAIDRAEKANKFKSEFLAQMSHEIRTPINTILSFSSLIKEDLSEYINEELKPSFMAMDNAGRRIIRTIDLILNMSEIQTGSYEPYFTEFSIEDIIENIYLELLLPAKNKGLNLIITKLTDDLLLYADNYTIGQILNNLIDNAIKYTLKGQVEIVINKNSNNELCVEIKDTGIGISKEYLPYLFTAFSQEETGYTRKFEGNGLGLALVKSYCEINNASIEVESEKNIGTTFRVTFHGVARTIN